MTNKKVIISLLAATVSASSLVAVNAADKINLDINKEVNESNSLIFGDFFGPKYTLNDKKAQKKLAEILDSIKGDYSNSESRIKTYDFIIEIDNYEIGLTKDANDNGYYILSFIRKDSPHNFNTYKTKVNIYSELMKVLNSSDGVSINLKNLNNPRNIESCGPVEMSTHISEATFGRNDNVVLVGKDSIPDALCSASIAGYLDAPILLSDKDELDEKLLSELGRLHAKNIYVLSGDKLISRKVKDQLKAKGYNLYDYSGQDRYETSSKIARFMNAYKQFILVSGQDFYDTPSISPYSYEKKIPILLTKKNSMPGHTYDLVKKDSSILAIGGDQTIDSDVYSQLSKKKVKLDKIAGKDRFDTSVKIVKGLYPESASYICINDKYIVKDIVTSVMSVKYQKPIVLEKNPYSFIENRDKNMYIVFK